MMQDSPAGGSNVENRGPGRSSRLLEVSLRPRWRGGLLLLVVTVASVFLVLQTIKAAISSSAADSPYIRVVRQALAFDPDNAELINRLGKLYSFMPNQLNMQEAVKDFRRAVELNPNNVDYWVDLASTCTYDADYNCSDRAMERAEALAPRRPRIQWVLANHYLQTDKTEEAFAHFRRLLEMSPDYANPTFRLCMRVANSPEEVYRKVLPEKVDPDVHLAFINYLDKTGNLDGGVQVWKDMMRGPIPLFPLMSIEPFIDSLIAARRFHNAAALWVDLEHLAVVHPPEPDERGNLVYNGGFERRPLNTGFDWFYSAVPYVDTDFGDTSAYKGHKCMRLDFTLARNDDVRAAAHFVPVEPDQSYLLTAFARSESITSDSGPLLQVVDAGCPGCRPLSTETTVGTTPWHPISLRFKTGPKIEGILISVSRPHSRVFPTDITGSFSLDEVSLQAVEPSGQEQTLSGPQ